MGMARLDPSLWNLGGPLMAIAACGPLVPVDDAGGTDTTDVTTVGEGPNPTGPNPTTSPTTTVAMTTSPSCYDVNCPPGYHCENGYCVYDGCYYADGGEGCCYDTCCGFECGWYRECYSNQDCPTGYFCEYNQCVGAPAEFECAIVSLDLQIPIMTGGEVYSLTFIDGNGDAQRDLVVGRGGGVDYVDGATLAVSTLLNEGIAIDVAVGDLDGDGDQDVAIADASSSQLRVLFNDNPWSGQLIAHGVFDLRGVAVGDVEGDGFPDIWGWSDTAGSVVAFNNGGPGMIVEAQYVFDPSTSLVTGDADGDALQDTALYSYQTYVLTDGPAFNAWGLWDQTSRVARTVAMANYNAAQYDDLIVFEAVNGVTLVNSFAGPVTQSQPSYSYWALPFDRAESIDMNVDGYVDLVAAYPDHGTIAVAYGAPEAPPDVINCVQYVASPLAGAAIAVGDLTGDGRPDVAVSDGTSVVVLAQSG